MKQNDIWLIDLSPTIGAEITKKRPCIIINDDQIGKLPLKIIVPITDWKEKYKFIDWIIKLNPSTSNNLKKKSGIDCFQMRSISEERMIKKIGHINEEESEKIKDVIKIIFSIK